MEFPNQTVIQYVSCNVVDRRQLLLPTQTFTDSCLKHGAKRITGWWGAMLLCRIMSTFSVPRCVFR
jgi:hypothetical protein